MYHPLYVFMQSQYVMCVLLMSFAQLARLCGFDLPLIVCWWPWVGANGMPCPCPLLALFGVHDKLLFGRLGAIAGGYGTSVPCPHAALLGIVLGCGKM